MVNSVSYFLAFPGSRLVKLSKSTAASNHSYVNSGMILGSEIKNIREVMSGSHVNRTNRTHKKIIRIRNSHVRHANYILKVRMSPIFGLRKQSTSRSLDLIIHTR